MSYTKSLFFSIVVRTLGFAFSLGSLYLIVRFAIQDPRGQRIDQLGMLAVQENLDASLSVLSSLGYLAIGIAGLLLAYFWSLQLIRRSWISVGTAVILVLGANVATQFLKALVVSRPDFGWGSHNSLPSGHTTMAASFAVAAIMIAPQRTRGFLVFLKTVVVSLAGVSTIIAGWHRPADVISALAVTGVWATLVSLTHKPVSSRTREFIAASILGGTTAFILIVFIDLGLPSPAGALVILTCISLVGATMVLSARLAADQP
ncbi:MAG: phosphatase PAP2 family protein [Aeromicrobium sp.]|nr:MAG: phosphatase PAP2 family protein [Aeromicrobium sp.]